MKSRIPDRYVRFCGRSGLMPLLPDGRTVLGTMAKVESMGANKSVSKSEHQFYLDTGSEETKNARSNPVIF